MTELYHFGIKGQRWGVRRFQSPDGTLTAAGKARYKAYKKDFKSYDKLNRHVSASQKHLKEEGVMLDRVRDKYLKTNKAYRKEMSRSSGLFGLKAAKKADRVAKAQYEMDTAAKDYSDAANKYGLAKKIVKNDVRDLSRHVDNMIRKYGEGSINKLQTETVKIGQNKLQKLLQGAPMETILNKSRETEEFIKTGKTLADLPVIGNLYTAKYIANAERISYYLSTWLWHYKASYASDSDVTLHGYSTFGATSVSVQHHHLDVYALLWVGEWLRLAELTGNDVWRQKALAVWTNGCQLISDGSLEVNGLVRPVGGQNEAFFNCSWGHSWGNSDKSRMNNWLVAWPGAFRLETLRKLSDWNVLDSYAE